MQHRISRRVFNRGIASGMAITGLRRPAFATGNPVLLELFTSQGCSDCPPADKLAGELSTLPGVLVISLNVDYWDYLGWKDTLAKPEFSRRQMEYAHARGDNDVYTPQMVINGATHAIGSRRAEVEAAIAKVKAPVVSVAASISGDAIEINVGEGIKQSATLWVMGIAPQVSVPIQRGENAGREIVYHNAVRQLVEVGSWNGEAQSFKLATTRIAAPDCKSCVAILQAGRVGPALGFATLAI